MGDQQFNDCLVVYIGKDNVANSIDNEEYHTTISKYENS